MTHDQPAAEPAPQRKITRRLTPHGWVEYLEPDWDALRAALADQPEPTLEERLAAARRYMLACWKRTRP